MVRDHWNFHVESTTTGNGNEYKVYNTSSNTTMMLSISGTATTRTVIFQGKGLIGDYINVQCYNNTTATLATQTTGITDELWVVDLTGLSSFRCNITELSGGNLSIFGKVVE